MQDYFIVSCLLKGCADNHIYLQCVPAQWIIYPASCTLYRNFSLSPIQPACFKMLKCYKSSNGYPRCPQDGFFEDIETLIESCDFSTRVSIKRMRACLHIRCES